ncbi:hypothetical protein D3C87_2001500 [compost metagenome]
MPRGQLVLVLLDVGCRDHELRLVTGKRIAKKTIVERRRTGLQATGPGWNAAVGIGLFLRPQRRQGGAQLGRFLRGDSGHDPSGQQRQTQCAGAQN